MPGDRLKTCIERILREGYLIEAEAYNLLLSMDGEDLPRIVDGALRKAKEMEPQPLTITREMLEREASRAPPRQVSVPVSALRRPLAAEYEARMEVLLDPSEIVGSGGSLKDFHSHFEDRYRKLSRILMERSDVRDARPLSEALKSSRDKPVKSIVMISDKRERGNRIFLRIEDLEGEASAIVPSGDLTLYRKAQRLSLDQVVCLELARLDGALLLVRDIIFPGLPERKIVKTDTALSALLISDIHLGSKTFLYEEFDRLLRWLRGDLGNPRQRDRAGTVKYVVISGDLVDGVGVYPSQEYELEISSIYEQYAGISKYLELIPDYVEVIVIPGNHDAARQALPQPAIPREFAEPIYSLEVRSLGNPAWIKIEGRVFLLYHGTSFNDVISSVPGLSLGNPEEALRYLMEARHLAPSFGKSTPLAPELMDLLVVDRVPDVVQSGHIHVEGYENYRGTLLVSCAAWQAQTEYQRRMGLTPTTGKAVMLNLGSLDVRILDFKARGAPMAE
ncbi:MAG: DNA-directed DNA polymerase II small subunit [Candidatus Bathyarchaeia archaeon]